MASRFIFTASGESNRGAVRANNEDAFCLTEKNDFLLAAVADGVSCQGHGDVASSACCKSFAASGKAAVVERLAIREELEVFLRGALLQANSDVRALDRARKIKAETTLCALALCAGGAGLIHVGDSRIYRLRDGALSLLTADHTLSEKYLAEHGCFPAEREKLSCMIYRAVGSKKTIEGDFRYEKLMPCDRFLLCTDGLYREIDFEEIEKILRDSDSPRRAVDKLMRAGFLGGAHDNMTAAVVFADEVK
ncbi:MAG: protein phosphatase 2C domain-containing protein [Victivallaceae bacterium]|nr:protein phosphatase 2C domain-containing protein [Victivallaceae bacterium]